MSLHLDHGRPSLDPNRPVGYESRKAYARRCADGFWDRWIKGPRVVDVGFRGGISDAVPIVPGAIGVDLSLPNGYWVELNASPDVFNSVVFPYDGFHLSFVDGFVDTVHASHVLEHVEPPETYLEEWFRVLRVGGTMIIMVPHAFLYERRLTVPPSRWSGEHLRSYTPAKLLAEIERALLPNSYRIRHVADDDTGYDYSLSSDVHPTGCLEIACVVEKIEPPAWWIEP